MCLHGIFSFSHKTNMEKRENTTAHSVYIPIHINYVHSDEYMRVKVLIRQSSYCKAIINVAKQDEYFNFPFI
jgi:hypothetical protein